MVQELVDCYGVVVDFVIYVLYEVSDVRNYYVYIFMIMWQVMEDGLGDKIYFECENKWFLVNDLLMIDMQFCDFCQRWEGIVNEWLVMVGFDIWIDYCLYMECGFEIVLIEYMGVYVMQMEWCGFDVLWVRLDEEVVWYNVELIWEKFEQVLIFIIGERNVS